jgi:hypothetical protein
MYVRPRVILVNREMKDGKFPVKIRVCHNYLYFHFGSFAQVVAVVSG